MCTVNVTVDEAVLHDVLPEPEELNRGLEPDFIYADDDETVDLETARQMTLSVIREEYARP
jgi:hypothetical protein